MKKSSMFWKKTVEQKFCIKKTPTFTIIASNFVREQLIRSYLDVKLANSEGCCCKDMKNRKRREAGYTN